MRKLHGLAQWSDCFRRMAAFQKRLTFELVKIRIVWLRLNRAVDLCERLAQV